MMQYFLNDGQVVFINFVYVCDFPLFFMCVIAACVLSYLINTRFAGHLSLDAIFIMVIPCHKDNFFRLLTSVSMDLISFSHCLLYPT